MAVIYVAAAWVVMEVAGVLIDLAELPGGLGRIVLALLAVGFPIALILSWFYELTPEGLALERDVKPGESITHITGRRLDFVIISLLSAAVLLFAWHTWWPSVTADNSIAVLAFDNMSADPTQEYFSDGIAEELLNALAQEPELRVASRSSSFSLKGKGLDIPTMAETLNVAHVVEGSVRTQGNRVRITAQLIDASTDSHLWSQTYDRELEDIFRIQQEISVAIVAALRESLGIETSARQRAIGTTSNEAYDAFLRGRYLIEKRTQASKEGAIREFRKAIDSDPEYARAHAELAMALILTFGSDWEVAADHVERAMTLDPGLAEGHAAKGLLAMNRRDKDAAMASYRRAVEINPSYTMVHTWTAWLQNRLGNYQEAFAALEKARQLDPLSVTTTHNYAMDLIARGQLAEAQRVIEELAELSPHMRASINSELEAVGGNWAAIALGSLEAMQLDPDRLMWANGLVEGLVMLGLDADALAMIEILGEGALFNIRWGLGMYAEIVADASDEDLVLIPDNPVRSGFIGIPLAAAGQYEQARPFLEDFWKNACSMRVTISLCYTPPVVSIVATRRALSEDDADVIAAIRDNVHRLRQADITITLYDVSADFDEGLADFLDGDGKAGLRLMERAARDGYFVPLREPYLQMLYDDPGFARIRDIAESHQARERGRFLAIVCNENPYADVWEPRKKTCETFLAATGT
jgi:TolB-like protein